MSYAHLYQASPGSISLSIILSLVLFTDFTLTLHCLFFKTYIFTLFKI